MLRKSMTRFESHDMMYALLTLGRGRRERNFHAFAEVTMRRRSQWWRERLCQGSETTTKFPAIFELQVGQEITYPDEHTIAVAIIDIQSGQIEASHSVLLAGRKVESSATTLTTSRQSLPAKITPLHAPDLTSGPV
ncbi:hypothetical protein KCU99_g5, partial [Aureobasidium melanogenum]